MKESKVNDTMLDALLDMMGKYIHQFSIDERNKNEMEMERKGSWPFIPNNTRNTLKQFILLKEFLSKEKRWSGHESHFPSFIDVGCGIGNILVFAKRLLYYCNSFHGLEISDDIIEKAKTFIYPYNKYDKDIHIHKQNILLYDKYNEHDIIYYYCPLKKHSLEKKLELMIEDQMKVGAILVPHFKQDHTIGKDKRFKRIRLDSDVNYIYLKISE